MFSGIDSCITHISVTEYFYSPQSPPPPSSHSINNYKTSQCLVISVHQLGHVLVHKAYRKDDGAFEIGMSWWIDSLTAVEIYGGLVQTYDRKMRPLNNMFKITVCDMYHFYWQALSRKERESFTGSLVKIYRRYAKEEA